MRWSIVLTMCAASTGCIHHALERQTVNQASTTTDVQYQQVVDNLAMFADNPDSLAWHMNLTGSTIQVTDQGTGQLLATLVSAVQVAPQITGSRTIVTQWAGQPTVDNDSLEMLSLAYKKMFHPDSDEIKRDIRAQIWRLATNYEFYPHTEILLDIMKDAVDDQFERHKKSLEAAREVARDARAVQSAIDYLSPLQDLLKRMIDRQRFGATDKLSYGPPSIAREYQEFSARAISLDAALGDIDLPRSPNEIASRFDRVKRAIHFLADQKGVPPRLSLETILCCLNPRIKEHLVDQSKNEKDPNCKVSFTGLQANVALIVMIRSDTYFIPQVFTEFEDVSQSRGSSAPKREKRNPGLIDQAQGKVSTLMDLLNDESLQKPWFGQGGRKDVPDCACYVGKYRGCGRESYVWVMHDQLKMLKKFALVVASLDPVEQQDSSSGRGAAFSPGLR